MRRVGLGLEDPLLCRADAEALLVFDRIEDLRRVLAGRHGNPGGSKSGAFM